MQRKKIGTAVVWMVCLLGMVAVVWSRPPIGGSSSKGHPPLALAGPENPPVPLSPVVVGEKPQTATPENPVSAIPSQTIALEPWTIPAGTWVREVDPYKMKMEFQGHELQVTIQGVLDEEVSFECQLSGEYHITQDSMLYGVISSGELRTTGKDPEIQFEADTLITECFYDQPFAFRYRLDQDTLTIKNLKMGLFPSEFEELAECVKLVPGRFHPPNLTEGSAQKEKPVFR